MNTSGTIKMKRSVELTASQVKHLKRVVSQHESTTQAGLKLGVSKDVLSRTIAFRSCSEKTYQILFPEQESLKGAA